MAGTLAARITRAPRPHDRDHAAEIAALFADADPDARDLLAGTAGCSGYLNGLMRREADWLREALDRPPEAALAAVLDAIAAAPPDDLSATLRTAKRRAALLIALADLGGVWDLAAVTGALTDLADRAVQAALSRTIAEELARGKLPGCDERHLPEAAGMFILAS